MKVDLINPVNKNSNVALMNSISLGPTSVAIEADRKVFNNYISGILTDSDCGTSLDHGVLAVGWGTENGTQYILVKNSWSKFWGENGYIRIASVDGEGICGINMDPVRPTTIAP